MTDKKYKITHKDGTIIFIALTRMKESAPSDKILSVADSVFKKLFNEKRKSPNAEMYKFTDEEKDVLIEALGKFENQSRLDILRHKRGSGPVKVLELELARALGIVAELMSENPV
jgi:hypothetical protein